MIFLFPRWDMLIPWRVLSFWDSYIFRGELLNFQGGIMLVVYPKKSKNPDPSRFLVGLMVEKTQNGTMTIGEIPFLGHISILRDSYIRETGER